MDWLPELSFIWAGLIAFAVTGVIASLYLWRR